MSKAGFSKETRVYVPKCRKSDNPPPTFSLRRLNPLELLDITAKNSDENETIEIGGIEDDKSGKDGDRKIKISLKTINKLTKSKYDVLSLSLSGWSNIEDESGQPIPFSKEAIPYLDVDIVNELSEVAQGSISFEEVKNSEPPSA